MDWPKLVKSGWPKRDWSKSVPSEGEEGAGFSSLLGQREARGDLSSRGRGGGREPDF